MTNPISNSDNIINTSDLIARIAELESEREDLQTAVAEEGAETEKTACQDDLDAWDDANGGELKALQSFAADIEPYCADFKHGETLINESYFEEYAEELAKDVGVIDKEMQWPLTCIDWEQAASELQQDYTSAEYNGTTFWFR